MSTESSVSPAQQIAAGYVAEGPALELGTVVVGGEVDPAARIRIPLAMLNRHGLVAGATGTGKTKTLQVMAEQLSAAGVPVLMADIKGDLSGLSRPGRPTTRRPPAPRTPATTGRPRRIPVEFLSLGTGGIGVPVRATISAFGPILLSKVLGLNATQESTLGLIFHWADQKGLPLLDLKDLRSVITYLTSDEGKAELKALGARVVDDGRRDPARAGQPRGRGRRHLLRRARVRPDRPAAPRSRRAAASSACSSSATRPPGR